MPGSQENQDEGWYNADTNFDEETKAQQKSIEDEIAAKQDYLVNSKEDFTSLEKEYEGHPEFLEKVQILKDKYSCMRRIRADGNCFYRAFGFAVFEALMEDEKEYNRFVAAVHQSKETLFSLGYQQFTVEDFYENFVEELQKVGKDTTISDIESLYNNQGMSDYLVVYIRLITSAYLQQESDFFSNFVEGGRSMKEFCVQDVEPMGRETDHLQMMAITQATGLCVQVFCMERGNSQAITFPSEGTPNIHLLFRPGHYDILYVRSC